MKQLYQVQIEWHYEINPLCKLRTMFIVLADIYEMANEMALDLLIHSESEHLVIDNVLCNDIDVSEGIIYCQTINSAK